MYPPWLLLLLSALCMPFLPDLTSAARFQSHALHLQTPFPQQNVSWFEQKLDHFSPLDRRTFSQRWFEYNDFFKSPNGPVFLLICGEATCNGVANDYRVVLAEKFGAAVVSLEHRYYGKSFPFTTLTTANLTYLTIEQALADLAAFRNFYQTVLNERYNRTAAAGGPAEDNPWLIIGISYAGAMSAWFRLKYPHLVRGSIASSAVVLAIYDFFKFDQQVADSAGESCASALRTATSLVEEGLKSDPNQTKAMFLAESLNNDEDFLYFLADAVAEAFQYGHPGNICPLLVAAHASGNLLEAFSEFVKTFFIRKFGVPPRLYDQEVLKNVSMGEHTETRMWWFQCCTQVAFLQTAPPSKSIRSSRLTIQYFTDLCQNLFGDGVVPDVDQVNLEFGGSAIKGTRIFFTNGSQDPWKLASKITSSWAEPSVEIVCDNCGHGVDLRGCPSAPTAPRGSASNCSDPAAVMEARDLMEKTVEGWLLHSPSVVLSRANTFNA